MIIFLFGIISGIATGLGLGGGTILVILLTIFQNIDQKLAQGINLVFFIPTSIVTLLFFIKNKQLKIKEIKENISIIIGGIIGAYLGANISSNFNNEVLKKIFAIFILLIALLEIYKCINNKSKKIKNKKIKIKK